jgi:hypothetical protein
VTYLWLGAGLAVLWCARRWLGRRAHGHLASGLRTERPPRRRHRLGDRGRRGAAHTQARQLVLALAFGTQDPVAHLAAGVVLEEGEIAFQQSRARLETWSTASVLVTDSRGSWWSRRVKSTARQVTVDSWRDHREFTWLLTSARAVGRSAKSGELVSIWWASLEGADVDVREELVILDATNGWRGRLSGPGIAPIAVAAVAACYGPTALLAHPGLACLRQPATAFDLVRCTTNQGHGAAPVGRRMPQNEARSGRNLALESGPPAID